MHPPPGVPEGPGRPSSSATPSSPSSSRRRVRVDSFPSVNPAPEAKRARSGEAAASSLFAPAPTAGVGGSSGRMAGAGAAQNLFSAGKGKRPEVMMDLTRRPAGPGAAFQPHTGAKTLVIKNLRAASSTRAADVERYYERTWADLQAALRAVFASRPPALPLERLYRGVEDVCRDGQAEKLFRMLRDMCEAHLNEHILSMILAEAKGLDDVDVLRIVLRLWATWSKQSILIRSTFSYLDRSYLLPSKHLPQIDDMVTTLFRRMVFPNKDQKKSPGDAVLRGMCRLVDQDRRGNGSFDTILFKEAVSMMHVFNSYTKRFEPPFLEQSAAYFTEFANDRSANSDLRDYVISCEKLLKREDYRCNAYNLDSSTKKQLLDDAHRIAIKGYSSKLLDEESVAKMLDNNDVPSLKALHELLRLSGIHSRLQEPWEAYIKNTGASIVTDVARGDEMAVRLLELRRRLDVVVRDAFGQDDDFTWSLREAFGHFINDKTVAASWDTGTSKVGEMIAKHIDMLLRGGLKTLPSSLLSDRKDRATAEREGLSSTGDEDAELDRQLDRGLELFRFIQGKDVFQAFYKKDLARRLLMGRSASQDAERNMLGKLKSECGSNFTQSLEQMFKDQQLGRDEMTSYKAWNEGSGSGKRRVDLQVSILSAAAWPTYPDVKVQLPAEVLDQMAHFEAFYTNKHTGRMLTWKHGLAHCVIKASFPKGPKELMVSAFQAAVLVLFNQVEDGAHMTYHQIAQATGLAEAELGRTLQSLACGRVRVLQKTPKGKEVGKTDRFAVNAGFTDPKYRVKINQIQLKETKEENTQTHQRVVADRQFETQAAIVRIMKSRKTLAHAQLVAEVIKQTSGRGAMDPADIKLNIERLMEKDYLDREGNNYVYLA